MRLESLWPVAQPRLVGLLLYLDYTRGDILIVVTWLNKISHAAFSTLNHVALGNSIKQAGPADLNRFGVAFAVPRRIISGRNRLSRWSVLEDNRNYVTVLGHELLFEYSLVFSGNGNVI